MHAFVHIQQHVKKVQSASGHRGTLLSVVKHKVNKVSYVQARRSKRPIQTRLQTSGVLSHFFNKLLSSTAEAGPIAVDDAYDRYAVQSTPQADMYRTCIHGGKAAAEGRSKSVSSLARAKNGCRHYRPGLGHTSICSYQCMSNMNNTEDSSLSPRADPPKLSRSLTLALCTPSYVPQAR